MAAKKAARASPVRVQSVRPFLWYNDQALEAARFYVSLFEGSRVVDEGPMSVELDLAGQRVIAFNGGPHYALTPAVSLMVTVRTQREVDDLWGRLTAGGGQESRCGWLVDRFGLSWQIIPERLPQLLFHDDPEVAKRAMEAMMKMGKIDVAALDAAVADVIGRKAPKKKAASKGAKKAGAAKKRAPAKKAAPPKKRAR